MAVVTAVIAFDDGAWLDTTARELAQHARRYPALDIEPLMRNGILAAHHLIPRGAASRGRLALTRPDADTAIVGGPGRSHETGATVARELASPGSVTADMPYAEPPACAVSADEPARRGCPGGARCRERRWTDTIVSARRTARLSRYSTRGSP